MGFELFFWRILCTARLESRARSVNVAGIARGIAACYAGPVMRCGKKLRRNPSLVRSKPHRCNHERIDQL